VRSSSLSLEMFSFPMTRSFPAGFADYRVYE
jgi:hypothetical protein